MKTGCFSNKNRRVSFVTNPVTNDSDKDADADETNETKSKSPEEIENRITDRPEIRVDSPARDETNNAEKTTKKRRVIKTRPKTKIANLEDEKPENESVGNFALLSIVCLVFKYLRDSEYRRSQCVEDF